MDLRIYRAFEWVRAPYGPGKAPTFGGPPRPLVLEPTDTLQFRSDGGEWQNVPIYEAERPPPPERKDQWRRPF